MLYIYAYFNSWFDFLWLSIQMQIKLPYISLHMLNTAIKEE